MSGDADTNAEADTDPSTGADADTAPSDHHAAALKPHQRSIPDRGIYDERNRLNDLTGREWKFATKSVITDPFPPDLQHDLRSEHGGQKPPRLCMRLVERFSKAGDLVLDPFAGVGGTLLGASLAEYEGTGLREAVGFERTKRWVEVYHTVLNRENRERDTRGAGPLAEQDLRHGDCARLVDSLPDDSIDLLLTDVPYWSMDTVSQTRNPRRTRASKLGRFDESNVDDAPLSKDAWLNDLTSKFELLYRVLRTKAYVLVFIGDMYRESSFHFLSAELATRLESTGLVLKADLIWYDPTKPLHVYGYPYAFVPSMVHQHVLVFRVE